MNEWLRIFSHRKRRAAIVLIPLVCLFLFFYQKCDGDFSALITDAREYQQMVDIYRGSTYQEIKASMDTTWGLSDDQKRLLEQAEHLESYEKYLAQVQQQAANMQASSLFNGNKNSFVYRNIVKTAADFAGCTAEGVYFGNYRAVQDWLEFTLADWAFLVMIVLLVMAFQEERRKGLSAIIRACPAGRGRLQGARLGMLLCYCAGMAALLYLVPLALSLCMDGGWGDLLRPVQSMAEFRKCTAQLSILEFLEQFFLVKIACGFLLGLLIWFILSFLNQVQLSWMLTAAGLAAEYLLYTLIPPLSIFSPLRYVNVFSYVFTGALYTQYVNINFFEFAVQSRTLLLGLLAVLAVGLGALTVWVLTRRYPFGNKDHLEKWLHRFNRGGDFFRRRLGLVGFEWYKLLLMTAGGLFLVLGFAVIRDFPVNSGAYNLLEDRLYRQYVTALQGPITEETYRYIADAWAYIKTAETDVSAFAAALTRVEATIEALPEGAWLVDEAVFLNIYGPAASMTQRRTGLYALLYLVACLAPLFACETSGDVRKVLRSTPGGRGRLFGAKYAVALGVTVIVWLVVFGREYGTATVWLSEEFLAVPCGSISILQGYDMTLQAWLNCMYLTKLLGLLVVTHLCIFLAQRSKSFEQAFLLSGAILLLPAAAYSFGVDALGWFTPLAFLAEGNILLNNQLLFALWLTLSLAAVFLAKRHWSNH